MANTMSSDINAYKLPVCDVATEYRNFPGYAIHELPSPAAVSDSGTTVSNPLAQKAANGNAYDAFFTKMK